MENLPNGVRTSESGHQAAISIPLTSILGRKFSSEKVLRGAIATAPPFVWCGSEKEIRSPAPRIALLSFREVNDVPQACIKSSQLACAPVFQQSFLLGG
jgi:hypothetical protein